jgi:hypothetical protein
MKTVYNRFVPFKGFCVMNLFGLLFVRKEYKGKLNEYVYNHECIHTEQMKELGYIFFYIIYFIEWLIRLFMKGNAYRNISFEKEAYSYEYDLDYLNARKHFAQWMKKRKKL